MKRVAVVARVGRAEHDRLFGALGEALGVAFVDRAPGEWRDVDAAVVLDGDMKAAESAAGAGLPALVYFGAPGGVRGPVALHDEERLDPRLRGFTMTDDQGSGAPVPVSDGDAVLASCEGTPRWFVRRGDGVDIEVVALRLEPLGAEEAMRDALKGPRFLSLLPLVHFLRRLTSDHGWVAPPLRACFIFDDPNLHWRSYGHVRYRELSREAERQGFHAAMAMVPLDGWFAHGDTTRIFRDSENRLSLLIHGNDHVRREMKRPNTDAEALSLVGQALSRIVAFERRTGVPVARAMVPPHGGCSPLAARAMSRLGFEGMCGTRIRPRVERDWSDQPLAEWEPSDFAAGGLPILTRHPLGREPDDLVLRAYLGQPLLIYGHHEDLAEGLDVLSSATAAVRSLGTVRWGPVTDIIRSNFATRREGAVLGVRLYSRRVSVKVPEGVVAMRVELARSATGTDWAGLQAGSSTIPFEAAPAPHATELIPVTPGETVDIAALASGALELQAVPTSRRSVWPLLRRSLTEGRDRLTPLVPALSRRFVWDRCGRAQLAARRS